VAARLRVAQGHHLGVRPAGGLRVALPQHGRTVRRHDHAAHARVRVGQADRLLGERQRQKPGFHRDRPVGRAPRRRFSSGMAKAAVPGG